jgi:hypothetical protein
MRRRLLLAAGCWPLALDSGYGILADDLPLSPKNLKGSQWLQTISQLPAASSQKP